MRKFVLTAVFAFIAAYVYSQERIAVFPFQDMENVLTRNQAFMFYDEFSNEFANRNGGRFAVVERQDVDRLINTEMAFQLTDFSAQEKTAEMMRVQNATRILSGTIGMLNDDNNRRAEIRITVSLYTYPDLVRLPGGRTLSVANTTELFSKIPELVQQMQNIIAAGGTITGDNRPVSSQEYDNENDFRITPLGNGEARIIRYIGTRQVVRIPPRIDGMIVTEIGGMEDAPFSGKEIYSVTIPDTVIEIGYMAFSNNQLTSVTIPNSVTRIGGEAFARNRLTSVTIPDTVIEIEKMAFMNNQLTSVTIPNSVTYIGERAFAHNQLTSVTIPNSVTSIDFGAFEDNQITSITIGANVDMNLFPFENGFFSFYYYAQDRRAGTYTYNNGSWSRR